MKRRIVMITLVLAVGIAIGAILSQVLNAQQDAIKMKMLKKADLVGIEGKEAVVFTAEIAPGAVGGKHYCTGNELAHIVKGSMILEIEGKPPVTYKAGDTFYLSPKEVHFPKNPSATTPTNVLGFAIIDKGQPINVMVK